MTRKIGFQDDRSPASRVTGAIMKYAVIDSVVIVALLAVIMYLHTDLLSSFGIANHQFDDATVLTYTIVAVVATAILTSLIFLFTVWPVLREARNAK